MGGKALNKYGVHTERKNTEVFIKLGYAIRESLYHFFLKQYGIELEATVVRCYRTKADHGDLDLLIKITPEIAKKNIDLREVIRLVYLPQAIHNNGGVYSFDYMNFQVDFIPIKEDKWNVAQTYYSYDPLGNVMGKTFHKFGLSYGWDGLHYKYRNNHGTNSMNILLTNDPRKIFEFGGYDYDRYLKGFDTLVEIFNFCIDTTYFDSEILQMDNLKSIDKKRNRKRGSYHLFLNYLKDNNIDKKYGFNKDKDSYISAIDLFFPEAKLMEKLEELKQKDLRDYYLAEKFNGNLVMEWLPELKGKELGAAIGKFKKYFGDSYETVISATSTEELKQIFMDVYNGKDQ
jgi:hypothetical protein